MSTPEQRIRELDLVLQEPQTPKFSYVPFTISGKLLFISGQVCRKDGQLAHIGKLGRELSVEQGADAARLCAIGILEVARAAAGGNLDNIARVLKLNGYVNSTPEFLDAPKCINGASDLLVAVFGDAGKHARTALSVASLPFGVAVEVEAVMELK